MGLLTDALRLGVDYWAGKDSERSGTDVGAEYGDAYKTSYPKIMGAHRDEAEAMMQKDLNLQRQFTPNNNGWLGKLHKVARVSKTISRDLYPVRLIT